MSNTWLQRLMKAQQKYAQVMRGRYGRNDQLNKALLVIWVIFLLTSSFIPYHIGTIIQWLLWLAILYRLLSKRIYVRANENQTFLQLLEKLKHPLANRQKKAAYRYFKCPECKQKMRAPRGRGKIKVTCKNCHTQFVKKV